MDFFWLKTGILALYDGWRHKLDDVIYSMTSLFPIEYPSLVVVGLVVAGLVVAGLVVAGLVVAGIFLHGFACPN